MQTQVEHLNEQQVHTDEAVNGLQAYYRVLQEALALSPELQMMLAQQLIAGLVEPEPEDPQGILDVIRERPIRSTPPPTDREITQWIDEYRAEKYS